MFENREKFAIDIKNPETYRICCAIWPHLAELNYNEIKNNLLVFHFDDKSPMALLGPGAIFENIEMIEPDALVQFKRVTLK